MHDGVKMLQVPLWRSYLAGCILLGIAPCTAMVLVWGYLSKGNDGHTLVMVAIFIPVAVMGGITGRLYQQFAITVAVSVAFSSINALTLSPALSAMLLKPPAERKKSFLDPFYRWFNELPLVFLFGIVILVVVRPF